MSVLRCTTLRRDDVDVVTVALGASGWLTYARGLSPWRVKARMTTTDAEAHAAHEAVVREAEHVLGRHP